MMRFCSIFIFFLSVATFIQAQNPLPVRFDRIIEYFPDNFAALRAKNDVSPAEVLNGRYVRYVQFNALPNAEARTALESKGVVFIGYVPANAYLVSLPEHFDLADLDKLDVRSIMPAKGVWKMSRTLREPPYGAWAIHGDQLDLNLQVYPHVGTERGVALCRQYGMTILKTGNQNGFIQVRVAQENLEAISTLPYIQFMELVPPPGKPEDIKSSSLHRSNIIDSESALGKHFNGDGVSVMVRDDGAVGPHIDFQGRLFNLTTNDGGINHGDWVSGALGGAGNLDPISKGMAAGAKIYVIDYVNDFQDQTLPLVNSEHITLTNSSYSDGCNAGYSLAAQTVDKQIHDNPTLLHVFSAGNSGTSDCGYGAGSLWGNITGGHKMAKNAIDVACVKADATIEDFSSRGPATDGRLKPDISADGSDVYMTQPGNTYSLSSGTSFSSPAIVGCLAQLTHGFKSHNNGAEPTGELLKSALLNTANDLGAPGPDFIYGWGHANAYRALDLFEHDNWYAGQVDQGQSVDHTVHIGAGTKQARLMIVWNDQAAMENASLALINDLDITVKSPGGTVYLPWKLNPDPLALGNLAEKGRDSLNNVEQVSIDNPAAGDYIVSVKGFSVPMGPQTFTLVWTFESDNVKITYPAGGEGFFPTSTERIHWDAYGQTDNFTLRYSTDNGASWNTVTTVDAGLRMYDWAVPATISGQVKLLLTRGSSQDTTPAFSIAPVPGGVEVIRVCPDSMTVGWVKPADTLRYDVYLLGNKYMEIIGNTDAASLTFPIQNPGQSRWVTARSSNAYGLNSRRAIAINWPGGLKNCVQQFDLAAQEIVSPPVSGIIACGSTDIPISARITNNGTDTISGGNISYAFGANTPVTASLPTITPGSTILFTFPAPAHISLNGQATLKIWTDYIKDKARFNDTLTSIIPVATQPATGYFTEDFEASPNLPAGWGIVNPDTFLTWQLVQSSTLIGINGNPTRALELNCYNYNVRGQRDYVYMIPVDLSNLANPTLRFDVAYVQYDNTYIDSLLVDVYPACNTSAAPTTIWLKGGADLATESPATGTYTPSSSNSWRTEEVSLQQFAGQSVIIRFTSVNDYGNNMYLDNIGIENFQPIQPDAAFSASVDSLCRLDTVVFQSLTTHPGQTTLNWSFGSGAQPLSATGPGPFNVRYLTSGNKAITLIAKTSAGADTVKHFVKVLPTPVSNFTDVVKIDTVTFTNTSLYATDYLWDFGDSQTSTVANPVHVYAGPGTYTVKLKATNQCSAVTKSAQVTTVTGVQDLTGTLGVRILPNPTESDFAVELTALTTIGTTRLRLTDAQGRLIKTMEVKMSQAVVTIPFEGLQLPKGLYTLNVQTDQGMQTFKVVVQ